jgi:TonB-linked SusC/RagA family outer membrane protein
LLNKVFFSKKKSIFAGNRKEQQLFFIKLLFYMNKFLLNKQTNVRKGLTFLCVFLFLLCSNAIFAQNVQVNGTVTDVSGELLAGVSVAVKGTTTGVITDIYGRFSLQVSPQTVLVFSYVGFLTQEIPVGNRRTIEVRLVEDARMIDEVVVIGYGAVRRSDVTGSIVSVNADEMMKRSPITVGQGLQGVAAGVAVYRNSGDPTGNVTVRVRGIATINNSADPVYVVDGIQVGTSINFLNPSDIESIEILKDASASAIYGAQGANGVILVTTKRGQRGQTRLNFTVNQNVVTRNKSFDVLNAYDFVHMARETNQNDGTVLTNTAWSQYDSQLTNIDWQKETTRIALQQNYNLSLTGGNENAQSMFSLGYTDNEGLVVNSFYRRLNARANVDYKVKDFIRTGLNATYSYVENRLTGSDGQRNSVTVASTIPTMDKMMEGVLENTPVRWDNGSWGYFQRESIGNSAGLDNPVASLMTNNSNPANIRIFSTAYIELSILKNLTFRTNGGFNYYTSSEDNYQERHERTYASMTQPDQLNFSSSNNRTLSLESYLTYTETFNEVHRINLMAGWSASKYDGQRHNINVREMAFTTLRQISNGNMSTLAGGGNLERSRRDQSFYGRAIYSFNDKYVFTGTVRRDGSSNFGPGNRYGTFPSASVLWRLSEESFMKNQGLFSKMNLRVGWGQVGNSGNSTNRYIEQLSTNRIVYWFYDNAGNPIASPGLAQTQIVDTNLKWETNETTNVNLEMGFLNNSLTFNVEYFLRDAKDLLLNRSVRPSTGYTSIYTNAGQIRNSGVDLQITYQNKVGDFAYNLKFNGGWLKNKVIEVGDPIWNSGGVGAQDQWNNWSRTIEGEPIASWYGYRIEGIFQSQAEIDAKNAQAQAAGAQNYQGLASEVKPGDFIFKDLDGNGFITEEDREVLGHGFPKFNYGLNIDLSYKNWDLSIFTYGVAGQKILSYSQRNLTNVMNGTRYGNILHSVYENAWRENAKSTEYARLTYSDLNKNRRVSDHWINNGDFLKISNIQLGYTFSRNLIRPWKMESLRLTFAIENPFLITGYKYGDPEIGGNLTNDNGVLQTGLDGGRYPSPMVFKFGLTVGF